VALDAYLRFRVSGQGSFTRVSAARATQLDLLEGWAEENAVEIGGVFEDLDHDPAAGPGPALGYAIERVEDGSSEGIVVARIDRLGRSATNVLVTVDRILGAGGRLVSVREGSDWSTPGGRLMLNTLVATAEFDRRLAGPPGL
jgi:DNA invertase Pin-like site-specific DNA recombinase